MNVEPRRAAKQLPIACELPEERQGPRREELSRELFDGCEVVRELEDGYEFTFPGSAEWAARLTEFVLFERTCCPFFTFEIFFEPDAGPIVLKVRGPEGVKEFIEDLAGLRPN